MKKHNFFRFSGIFVVVVLLIGFTFTNISCKKQEKVIKIGTINFLTDSSTPYCENLQNALLLAEEEINKEV